MAVSTLDLNRPGEMQDIAAQGGTNGLDQRGGQSRQIGQRALANLGAFTVGLTQEDGRGGIHRIRESTV